MCARIMLPFIDDYDERLSQLNVEELSVHLNRGGFSGLVIRWLPKAGGLGAEPLAGFRGSAPEARVFW